MPLKKKRERRPPLTDAQIEYLKTGKTEDPYVYLDWTHPNDRETVRAVFEAIRGDYPKGHFEWAEKEFPSRC